MARAGLPSRFQEHTLIWALGISVIAHALLGLWLHPIQFSKQPPKPSLTIELVKQEPPPPPPPQEMKPPEPPKPEPKVVKPQPKPEPVKRPLPPPKVVEHPSPAKPQEAPVQPEPPRPEAPPPVITAAPKPEEPPPAFTAPPPPPEPPKPVGPSEADIDAARQAYGNSLSREIGKHKRYPRIAQMRGWEGTLVLLLEIDNNGKVVSVRIESPSEREVFNTEAQEMVKRMVQPPPIPEALRGRSFNVRVPISFRLE